MRYLLLGLFFSFFGHELVVAKPGPFKTYPYDKSPLQRYPEWEAELRQIQSRLKQGDNREADLKRQLEIVASIDEKEPDWIDGHGLVAEKAFELGSFYTKEVDLPYARSVFVRGARSAERCLKQQKDNPVCKLLLGAMLGKIGSIDGVFSSIKQAAYVERLWLDVLASPYNHHFTPTTSIQGGARYALGMFYRLVPDLALVRWLFGVQGDKKKSVLMHREAIELDGPNTCNKVMLGVALICVGGAKPEAAEVKEGLVHLGEAKNLLPDNAVAKACWDHIPRLMTDLKAACGYESSRQQEDEAPRAK